MKDLLRDMHVRLLAGYAPDAVIHAAILAEAAAKALVGKPPEAKAMLGELLGELHRQGKTEQLSDANWLNQRRIAAVHFTGQVRGDLDADARRAVEIATRLAISAGIVTDAEVAESRRSAEWDATEPAGTALLRLDRVAQRQRLDDLLGRPRRVLVMLVQGEFGQGHDHFGQVTTWRLRAGPRGRWRELEIEWPAPSANAGTRYAMLLEHLAEALGVSLEQPASDPLADGTGAWATALAPVFAAIDQARERLLVRHRMRRLDDGASGDPALVERYVREIWSKLAARAGERIVVALDVRRTEHAGIPLSAQWRAARGERRVAAAIESCLERTEMPRDGLCATLPELGSVTAAELADWLRDEAGQRRDDASSEATRMHATTRGGRFDLVVERLAALNLDRRR